jgi:hypothetical protein
VIAGELDAARDLYARLDAEAPDLQLPDYQRMQKRELTGSKPAEKSGAASPEGM